MKRKLSASNIRKCLAKYPSLEDSCCCLNYKTTGTVSPEVHPNWAVLSVLSTSRVTAVKVVKLCPYLLTDRRDRLPIAFWC